MGTGSVDNKCIVIDVTKKLTVLHINIQSLCNKLDNLELLLCDEGVDVLCLSEHWLQLDTISSVKIQGYSLVSNFSRTNSIHGGSLILVKDSLVALFRPCEIVTNASIESHSEMCSVLLNDVCIICCYRPYNGDFNLFYSSLSVAIANALKFCKYVILAGDLNVDYSRDSANKKALCDIFDSFNLKVTTNKPTRVFTNLNGRTSVSAIDYIVTNIPGDLFQCDIVNAHLSDHFAHRFEFQLIDDLQNNVSNKKIVKIRNRSQHNIAMFSNMLKQETWFNVYDSNGSVELGWANFMDTILYCLDCCCPYQNKCRHNKTSINWYNDKLRNTKMQLDNLYWLQRRTSDDNLTLQYKNLKKQYKVQIKHTKKAFYLSKIKNSNNKSKEIWNIVNNSLNRGNNTNYTIKLNVNNCIISDPNQIANEFVNYFSTASSNKLKNTYGSLKSELCSTMPSISNSIVVEPVSVDKVINIINNLKNKHSAGFDDINAKMLKAIKDNICYPLTFLINQSLQKGIFPAVLKRANVIPLHKGNDKEDVVNYRQISLISVFSKIMEKIVYEIILNFVTKYKIINECQHGFMPNRSIETASYRFLNYTHTKLDDGKYVVGLFF